MGPRHDQRRGDALVGHVAHGDPDPPIGHLDEVVEVAADRLGRAVERGDLPLGQLGQLARQELLLDERRDAQLLGQALAVGRLGRLLADELGDADGRGGLGRQRGQQPCDRRSSSPAPTGAARGSASRSARPARRAARPARPRPRGAPRRRVSRARGGRRRPVPGRTGDTQGAGPNPGCRRRSRSRRPSLRP